MPRVFFIIYFVMHHADIPFNPDYNSFKLLRTDSTLFFNTRLFLRKSHRDLFSVASNICFFFSFFKIREQSARCIKVSFGFDIISRKKSIIVFTLYHYSIRRWQEAIVARGIAPSLVDSIHTWARQHLLLEYLINKATP